MINSTGRRIATTIIILAGVNNVASISIYTKISSSWTHLQHLSRTIPPRFGIYDNNDFYVTQLKVL